MDFARRHTPRDRDQTKVGIPTRINFFLRVESTSAGTVIGRLSMHCDNPCHSVFDVSFHCTEFIPRLKEHSLISNKSTCRILIYFQNKEIPSIHDPDLSCAHTPYCDIPSAPIFITCPSNILSAQDNISGILFNCLSQSNMHIVQAKASVLN